VLADDKEITEWEVKEGLYKDQLQPSDQLQKKNYN
jgi:hypothetical protein